MSKKRIRKTFTFNGVRYYAEGKTGTEAIANRERMKLELEYGLYASRSMTVNQLADLYIKTTLKNRAATQTEKTYKQKLFIIKNHILPAIGSMRVTDVTQVHILQLLAEIAPNYTQNRVNHTLYLLNGMFKLAIASKQCVINPCQDIEKPQGKTVNVRREATVQERNEIYGHQIWIDMVILCGVRPGETAQIRFCDIYNGYMYVDGTKNKNAKRYVPLPAELRARILAIPHDSDDEYVCRMKDNKRSKLWLRLMRDLDMTGTDLVPHCFRHSFVTDLENCPGLPMAAVKTIVGHSMPGVTDNYTHSRQDTCIEALPKLIEYWNRLGLFGLDPALNSHVQPRRMRAVRNKKSVTFVTLNA